jgi:hypothetical protein
MKHKLKHVLLFENFASKDQLELKFSDFDCTITFSTYRSNDRIYMGLIDKTDGSPVADCTVNMPEVDVPEGSVLIKNYSENEGMVNALVQAKIVEKPTEWVRGQMAAICKLLVDPKILNAPENQADFISIK